MARYGLLVQVGGAGLCRLCVCPSDRRRQRPGCRVHVATAIEEVRERNRSSSHGQPHQRHRRHVRAVVGLGKAVAFLNVRNSVIQLGFNCGSTFGVNNNKWQFAERAAVTTLNGSFAGGTVALAWSWRQTGKADVSALCNGILAGE